MNNTELDPLYALVFEDPKNGTPINITDEGCKALAQLGKNAWNAWRRQYPVSKNDSDEYVNTAVFSSVNFSELHNTISFEGFEFDCGANFSEAIFGGTDPLEKKYGDKVCFSNTQFKDGTRFDKTQFGRGANFAGAQFGDDASFKDAEFGGTDFLGTKFGGKACFSNAQFEDGTRFDKAQFGNDANFTGVQFGEDTSFDNAIFGKNAQFVGAQFDNNAFFDGIKFDNKANFAGAQFGDNASFKGAEFGDNLSFASLNWASLNKHYNYSGSIDAAKEWSEERGLSPEIFKSISFAGVNFLGRVDFSGRKFEGRTSFGRLPWPVDVFRHLPNGEDVPQLLPEGKSVQFGKAPLFHNCKLHPDTTFDGDDKQFPKPSSDLSENDTAARAYRTLKLAFSQYQATHEEQRFFRLEMAEEEKRSSRRLRLLFVTYRLLSCYGFSLMRPMLLLLIVPLFVFAIIYSWQAGSTPCFLVLDDQCEIRTDFLKFSLMQTFPLPGLDKWSDSLRQCLFSKQSFGLTLLIMFQKTISLLGVFLLGLALRNLFKLK